jgi:hypothetical protein
VIEFLVIATALLAATILTMHARRGNRARTAQPTGRILFPFVGRGLSERALEACLRLAVAEHAVLVPACVVTVPMALSLDAPVPRACETAFELLEAIEQRAAASGVAVDGRVGRGRTVRHAMRDIMAGERFDRIVAAAGDNGFDADDIAWLLRNAPGEVLVIRPAAESAVVRAAA